MTVREAIVNTIAPITAPDGAIDLALANAGLNATATYNSSMQSQVETAAVYLLLGVSLVTSEREGEYQVTYDKTAIRAKISFLAKRNGLEDVIADQETSQPVIKDISYMW